MNLATRYCDIAQNHVPQLSLQARGCLGSWVHVVQSEFFDTAIGGAE